MEKVIDALLFVHVFAGALSLVVFWVPVFVKKRKGLHTQVGKWYVVLMWIVVVSAALLSFKNLVVGHIQSALFLGFLSCITANPLWYAIQVMKNKKAYTQGFIWWFGAWQALVVSFAIVLLVYGVFFVDNSGRTLLIIFGVLGLTSVRQLLNLRVMTRASKTDWYRMHYSGMVAVGIASYTAFLAFGGRAFLGNVLTDEWQIVPWVLPTVVGMVAIRVMDSRRRVVDS